MPVVHLIHDALPDFLPEWIKWGLILILEASLAVLIYQLSQRAQQWWSD
jgi:hypothetical protein